MNELMDKEALSEIEERLYSKIHHEMTDTATTTPDSPAQFRIVNSSSVVNNQESVPTTLFGRRAWQSNGKRPPPLNRNNLAGVLGVETVPDTSEIRSAPANLTASITAPFKPYTSFLAALIPSNNPTESEITPPASASAFAPAPEPVPEENARQNNRKKRKNRGKNTNLYNDIMSTILSSEIELKRSKRLKIAAKRKKSAEAVAEAGLRKKCVTITLDSSNDENDNDDVIEIPVPPPPMVCIDSSDESVVSPKELPPLFTPSRRNSPQHQKPRSRGISPSSSILSDDFIMQNDRSRLANSLENLRVPDDIDLEMANETVDSILNTSKKSKTASTSASVLEVAISGSSAKSKATSSGNKVSHGAPTGSVTPIAHASESSSTGGTTSERVKQKTISEFRFVMPEEIPTSQAKPTADPSSRYEVTANSFEAFDVYESESQSSDMPDSVYSRSTPVKPVIEVSSDSSSCVLESVRKLKKFRKRKSSGSAKSSDIPDTDSDSVTSATGYICRGVAVDNAMSKRGKPKQKRRKMISENISDEDFLSMLSNIVQEDSDGDDSEDGSDIANHDAIDGKKLLKMLKAKEKTSEAMRRKNLTQTVISSNIAPIEIDDGDDATFEMLEIEDLPEFTEPEVSTTVETGNSNEGLEFFWNDEMKRFYNESWGGKRFNMKRVLNEMDAFKSNWLISSDDKHPKRKHLLNARCLNCNEFGHIKARCRVPMRGLICHMCGGTNHREPRCPNKICLRCGHQNRVYGKICKNCSSFCHIICNLCKTRGHPAHMCPDKWRRYHSTTEDNVPLNTKYLANNLRYCSICAAKGHLAEDCRSALRVFEMPVHTSRIMSYQMHYPRDPSIVLSSCEFTLLASGKNEFNWDKDIDPPNSGGFYTRFLSATQSDETSQQLNSLQVQEKIDKPKETTASRKVIDEARSDRQKVDKAKETISTEKLSEKAKLDQSKSEVGTKSSYKNPANCLKVTFNASTNSRTITSKKSLRGFNQNATSISATAPTVAVHDSDSNYSFSDYFEISEQATVPTSNTPPEAGTLIVMPDFIPLIQSELAQEPTTSDPIEPDPETIKCDAKIFLSKMNCKQLITEDGSNFLRQASHQYKMNVRIDFTHVGNVLVLHGTQQNQNEFRATLVGYLSKVNTPKNINLSIQVPRKRSKVIDFIIFHLKQLEKNLGNAKCLYRRLCMCELERNSKHSQKTIDRVVKNLNMILLGQIGLRDGKAHTDALLRILQSLRMSESSSDAIETIERNQINYHFSYIFTSYRHENYEDLINEYAALKITKRSLPKFKFREISSTAQSTTSESLPISPSPALLSTGKSANVKDMQSAIDLTLSECNQAKSGTVQSAESAGPKSSAKESASYDTDKNSGWYFECQQVIKKCTRAKNFRDRYWIDTINRLRIKIKNNTLVFDDYRIAKKIWRKYQERNKKFFSLLNLKKKKQ